MLEHFEIRSVKISEHYQVISGMMHELHKHEHSLFDKTASWPDIEASYMRHITMMQEEYDGTFLMAYLKDKPVGFIFGYIEEQDDSRIEIYQGKELYISDGYVAAEERGKGIYRKLNKEMERMHIDKGIRRICRHTLVNNTKTRNFLESEEYFVTRLLYEKWL